MKKKKQNKEMSRWDEEYKKHFDTLDCTCPRCGKKTEFVIKYEDSPQMFSGRCTSCCINYHYDIFGELLTKDPMNKIDGYAYCPCCGKLHKKSIEEKKVYCKGCKHYQSDFKYGGITYNEDKPFIIPGETEITFNSVEVIEQCNHEKAIRYKDTYSHKVEEKIHPSELNKNNDCPYFEKKEGG